VCALLDGGGQEGLNVWMIFKHRPDSHEGANLTHAPSCAPADGAAREGISILQKIISQKITVWEEAFSQ
jgi:hypothetical protein